MLASSNIPPRLDRLPWSRWHWRIVVALGVAWILDGLEVTIVGSIGGVLERTDTLALNAEQIGWAGSLYVGGAVIGALMFGRLADRLGRKRLFLMTLLVYMGATVATAFSLGFPSFAACRFVTGMGIGGVLSIVLLDERVLGPQLGWRAGFLLGAVLALAILLVRRNVPESPRWLLAHGRGDEAERIIADIEAIVRAQHGQTFETGAANAPVFFTRTAVPTLGQVAQVLLRRYPRRSAV